MHRMLWCELQIETVGQSEIKQQVDWSRLSREILGRRDGTAGHAPDETNRAIRTGSRLVLCRFRNSVVRSWLLPLHHCRARLESFG